MVSSAQILKTSSNLYPIIADFRKKFMREATLHNNEINRLNALLDLEVLDTPPEAIYNEIVQMATIICKTPVSFISLVDKDREWFKAIVGIDSKQSPRNTSFCSYTIENNDIFIIEDASKDERFKDQPMIIGNFKAIFYAGAPLTTPNGHNIGTLCVIDDKPNSISHDQILCLKTLAKLIVSHFLSTHQNTTIRTLNEEIQKCAIKVNSSTEQLIKTSKLVSLVEMAAGISHEINNPLTIIQGRAQILLNMFESKNIDEEKVKEYLQTIHLTTTRISNIIKGLKSFARNSEQDPFFRSNLLQIINESLEILEKKITDNNIDIKLSVSKEIYLDCRATQINQCFVNLISNSIDAIENAKEKWLSIDAFEDKDTIEMQFTDCGNGIQDPETIKRLMQPFFTTKKVGRGVGLGLSITKGIIESHKGNFMYNEKSKNTQFIIRLPKAQNQEATRSKFTNSSGKEES